MRAILGAPVVVGALASSHALRALLGAAPLRFALGDGTELCAGPPPHVATVVFEDRRGLLEVARDPDLGFGGSPSGGV